MLKKQRAMPRRRLPQRRRSATMPLSRALMPSLDHGLLLLLPQMSIRKRDATNGAMLPPARASARATRRARSATSLMMLRAAAMLIFHDARRFCS